MNNVLTFSLKKKGSYRFFFVAFIIKSNFVENTEMLRRRKKISRISYLKKLEDISPSKAISRTVRLLRHAQQIRSSWNND